MDKKLSGKESRELAQASCNHEVPWDINAEPSRVFEKAVDFRALQYLGMRKRSSATEGKAN